MPYPIVTDTSARLWWNAWKESGNVQAPPHPPEPETSIEGGEPDWPTVVARLMDDLGTLYDSVDGTQTAERGGVVGRITKALGSRAVASTTRMTNDRFEATACVTVHKALPRDAALADPEFWIWMATGPGLDLIRRRYPGKGEAQIPDRLNFTSASARETFFYRLWVRAELAHDPALEDPYELARYGDIDFWRSHVFRQMSTETGPLLGAFVRFQHPDGPEGKKRLSQEEIRELVKYMRRAAANVLVEALDEQEAARFVEEQWQKIQQLRSQRTAAE